MDKITINLNDFSPIDMYNLLEKLFDKYGKDKVITTMKSMFEIIESEKE